MIHDEGEQEIGCEERHHKDNDRENHGFQRFDICAGESGAYHQSTENLDKDPKVFGVCSCS
jgi:hypothetical protein